MAIVWLIGLLGVLVATAPVTWQTLSLPVRISALGFSAFGLLAPFAFHPNDRLVRADYVPISFYESVHSLYIVTVFVGIGICIVIGANLARIVLPPLPRSQTRLALRLPNGVLVFGLALVAAWILGVGPGYLLQAPTYLATTGSTPLLKLSNALMPLAVVGAAGVGFRPGQTRGVRYLAVLLLVTIEILFIGRASRSSAVFFAYVFAGCWLTGRWERRATTVAAVITVVVTLLFLGVPLELRTGPEFGIGPSLTYLITDPGRFLGGTYGPQNNVLIGVPLSLYVGRFLPAIPTHVFWTDVNPLPSGLTDWGEVSPALRVIPTQPYPAIGELLNYGLRYLVVFFGLLGAIFETLVWVARRARAPVAGALESAVTGLSGVLVIRATQYQLRTETRFVYYLAVIVVIGTVLSRVLYARPAVLRLIGPPAQREEAPARDVRGRGRRVRAGPIRPATVPAPRAAPARVQRPLPRRRPSPRPVPAASGRPDGRVSGAVG